MKKLIVSAALAFALITGSALVTSIESAAPAYADGTSGGGCSGSNC